LLNGGLFEFERVSAKTLAEAASVTTEARYASSIPFMADLFTNAKGNVGCEV